MALDRYLQRQRDVGRLRSLRRIQSARLVQGSYGVRQRERYSHYLLGRRQNDAICALSRLFRLGFQHGAWLLSFGCDGPLARPLRWKPSAPSGATFPRTLLQVGTLVVPHPPAVLASPDGRRRSAVHQGRAGSAGGKNRRFGPQAGGSAPAAADLRASAAGVGAARHSAQRPHHDAESAAAVSRYGLWANAAI